jgi:heptosyltransferase-2
MFNFPYQKILIVRLSSLGDILLTTPLIRSLKKVNPKLEIHFLLREEYQDVLINNPHLSKLITIKREEAVQKTKNILSQNKYDFVIDLQNNLRSRSLTSGLNCPKVRFKKLSLQKILLVKFKINKLSNAPPIPERYASVINDLKLDDEGHDLFTNNRPSNSLVELTNLIGFCPGSRHYTKMWPKEYYIELGKRLTQSGFNVVLFGGKDDQKTCEEISSNISECVNLCNDNDILQTAADMKMCRAIVCNDSGLMHTACAVKVPVIAIFGSTVKEFGFFPYRSKNLILENKSLSCRPCSHIGRSSCPKHHFKCMKEITPQLVYNSLLNFINQK